MSEKKYVTLEMFEKYHKQLVNYIEEHDGLVLEDKEICPECGAVMNNGKCENCEEEV